MKYIKFFILFGLLASFSANALLEVNIIKSKEDSFPVVIAPFEMIGNFKEDADLAKIIRKNLNMSGQFDAKSTNQLTTGPIDFDFYLKHKKDAIVLGKIRQISSNVNHAEIYIYDVLTQKPLYRNKIAFTNGALRKTAHALSDVIYYALLGQKGSFNTKLSFVTVNEEKNGKRKYRLVISDWDGKNQQVIIGSDDPILSPAWSADQRKIAYVSFKNNRSDVFVKYVFQNTNPIKLPKFDGIASSPTWHPDGKSLALTLSKDGNKDIYLYNFDSKKLKRLTTNIAIDTEANFSPDGKSIAFTSNRTGQVQIYIKNLKSGKISRATFEGRYNAKPVFSPDGKDLALIHRVGKDYRLALLDITSRDLTVLTQNKSDESPYFSPNGGMIIYSTNRDNKGILSIISLHNYQTVELMQKEGEVREPSWSNYSN